MTHAFMTQSKSQDVGAFAEEMIQLPRPPEELPIVIMKSPGEETEHNFQVNRKHILEALSDLLHLFFTCLFTNFQFETCFSFSFSKILF